MFSVREEARGPVVVLYVVGHLDALVEDEASKTLDDLITKNPKAKLVVDVGDMTLIDSSGIGVLVGAYKHLRANDGDMKLARLTGQPQHIFKLLRLDRSIEVCPTVDDAVAKYSG